LAFVAVGSKVGFAEHGARSWGRDAIALLDELEAVAVSVPGRDVDLEGGNVNVNGGDVNLDGGNVNVNGGDVNPDGGSVDVCSGDVNLDGGSVRANAYSESRHDFRNKQGSIRSYCE